MTDSTLNRFLASGTAAQRLAFTPSIPSPASGPHQLYIWFEEDTGDCYAYNQNTSLWVKIDTGGGGGGGGATYTKPVLSAFTQDNLPSGGSTSTLTNGIQLYAPSAGSAFNCNLISQAAPTAPYTKWARVSSGNSMNYNFWFNGIAVIDSGGKFLFWGPAALGGYDGSVDLNYMNSATSRATADVFTTNTNPVPLLYGVRDDGTNMNFLVSYDGVSEFILHTESRTAFLSGAAARLGLAVAAYSQPASMNIVHWADTLPGPL